MTHDPLCSVRWPCDHPVHFNMRCSCICGRICQCNLIAQVRADMLAKCVKALDDHHPRCIEPCDLCAEWSALREGLEALAGRP